MKYDLFICFLLLLNFGCIQCYRPLSTQSLKQLEQLSTPETLDHQTGRHLVPLLVERVVGTASHAQVRRFIVDHFDRLDWKVEQDTFTAQTPLGEKTFTNVIATHSPLLPRRLVLAAHYDSMISDDRFIGATDSSVPCALLLSLSESLNGLLAKSSNVSLELVFFDGEEAMVHWTESDSIYGAKHLAAKWEQERLMHDRNRLQMIDVLVLLDLLGTPNPTFHNYFRSTSWLFHHLANLEAQLGTATMFPTFDTRFTFNGDAMQDDHLPFKDRGVDVLHLIPYPFPVQWHTPLDNADCLDPPTIQKLDLLFRAFVCEYLELDPVVLL